MRDDMYKNNRGLACAHVREPKKHIHDFGHCSAYVNVGPSCAPVGPYIMILHSCLAHVGPTML